jgi:hypothetical protein
MLKNKTIKVSLSGPPINSPTDIKIKMIKLLATSPEPHTMKPPGPWDTHQEVTHTTLTAEPIPSMLHLLNSTQQWLTVLKILDHIWLIKLKESLMDLFLSHQTTAQLLHGTHVVCAQKVPLDKPQNASVKLDILKMETNVKNVNPPKLL